MYFYCRIYIQLLVCVSSHPINIFNPASIFTLNKFVIIDLNHLINSRSFDDNAMSSITMMNLMDFWACCRSIHTGFGLNF